MLHENPQSLQALSPVGSTAGKSHSSVAPIRGTRCAPPNPHPHHEPSCYCIWRGSAPGPVPSAPLQRWGSTFTPPSPHGRLNTTTPAAWSLGPGSAVALVLHSRETHPHRSSSSCLPLPPAANPPLSQPNSCRPSHVEPACLQATDNRSSSPDKSAPQRPHLQVRPWPAQWLCVSNKGLRKSPTGCPWQYTKISSISIHKQKTS